MKILSKIKTIDSIIISFFCLAVIICLFMQFLVSRRHSASDALIHTGDHILFLMPENVNDEQNLRQTVSRISDDLDIRLETINLSTVSAQKEMLSAVPDSDIDGVLFWPVSSFDSDYSSELKSCKDAGIPIVLINQDFADKSLRNSYIGSGISSELLVINETMYSIDSSVSNPLVIGCYSNAGTSGFYELLFFSRDGTGSVDPLRIQNERLRAYVDNPPSGLQVSDYKCIRSGSRNNVDLDLKLLRTLNGLEQCGIFFSLDETLTELMATSINSGKTDRNKAGKVIGYGRTEELGAYIESGTIDELIVSDNTYSAEIGLKYLHDIIIDLWVPSSKDSGVRLTKRTDN